MVEIVYSCPFGCSFEESMKLTARRIWQYTLIVAMLVLVIGIVIDKRDVQHYADRMEQLMAEGDYQRALQVGDRSDKTDRQLMLLRIEALGHEHQLGERLFTYPLTGNSGSLVKRGGDYELCAYLIDKQLDRFVSKLPKYYPTTDNLPRHYREALVLYTHLRANPAMVYHDNVMDTDYRDMKALERRYADHRAREMAVFQQYEKTYWYYFGYK